MNIGRKRYAETLESAENQRGNEKVVKKEHSAHEPRKNFPGDRARPTVNSGDSLKKEGEMDREVKPESTAKKQKRTVRICIVKNDFG